MFPAPNIHVYEVNMSDWIEVGKVDDVPQLGARVVKTKAGDVAVFRTAGDEIFALRDQCPHQQGPLSQGIVHGKRVTCPLHNWVIELETGAAVAPDEGCAGHYPVQVENGLIYIALKS
jgi:nitrite reductase (NADH) small subunit